MKFDSIIHCDIVIIILSDKCWLRCGQICICITYVSLSNEYSNKLSYQ